MIWQVDIWAGLQTNILGSSRRGGCNEMYRNYMYCCTGFMQEVARAALLRHADDPNVVDQQDGLNALLIRPLLRSAAK